MAYKYFLSGSPVNFYPPSQSYTAGFYALLEQEFYNASNVFTIQEETVLGNKYFVDVDVRIQTPINEETGEKMSDDFKALSFLPSHEPSKLGEKFYFDNSYWIVVNTSSLKSLTNVSTIRRCNNILRWADSSGSINYEPCIIDYKIATPNNKDRTDPILPDGTLKIFCQLNNRTRKIKENQRFLFGNTDVWQAYRVYGGGVTNFLNLKTEDNTSAQILGLALGKNFVNEETDNLVLGIADYYEKVSGSSLVNNIKILPLSGSIVESGSVIFSCYLFSGATQLSDFFTFSVSASSIVPTSNYIFNTVDGNHFSVSNVQRYLTDSLIIDCISGSNIRQKYIDLRGDW